MSTGFEEKMAIGEEVMTTGAFIGAPGQDSLDFRRLVSQVRILNPNFLVVGGSVITSIRPTFSDYDRVIGRHFHDWMAPYEGNYELQDKEPGVVNKVWPVVGSGDYGQEVSKNQLTPYFDFFKAVSKKTYYFVEYPNISLFMLNSTSQEPDGLAVDDRQALWLEKALYDSDSAWKIVFFQDPVATSAAGFTGNVLAWPFRAWGADAVISSGPNVFERLLLDGTPHLIAGNGGRSPMGVFSTAADGSQFRYLRGPGFLFFEATAAALQLQAWMLADGVADGVRLTK